jgi:hypothetical protein
LTFRVIAGGSASRLSAVWIDDRCSPISALLSFDGIINGPGVAFDAQATPEQPPNAGAACPAFVTTTSFLADSGNTATAIQQGEYLALVLTLQNGLGFADLIECLQQSNDVPVAADCAAGLRVAIGIQDTACGSSAVNLSTPVSTGADCNENGVPDECDADCDGMDGASRPCTLYGDACGQSADCNSNDTPDECEAGGLDCD